MAKPPYPIIATRSPRAPRYTWLLLGALVLAGVGVAAAWMLRNESARPETSVTQAVAVAVAVAPGPLASAPLMARSAAVCAACGTVETVRAQAGQGYAVRVRMDDGALRDFNSATPPQPGAAVRVEGKGFRVLGSGR